MFQCSIVTVAAVSTPYRVSSRSLAVDKQLRTISFELHQHMSTCMSLQAAIANTPEATRPKVLVSSSAVGYYGASQSASFTEDSPAGNDYLAEICTEWEAAARRAPAGTRCVVIRTGIVLARDGGVLARMMPIFELFAGEDVPGARSLLCQDTPIACKQLTGMHLLDSLPIYLEKHVML